MICSNVTEPTSVARVENSSSVRASGAPGFSARRYTSMRRILCTLLSGAFRRGAGQLSITSLPCCAPESSSVRCCTRSTGGRGGRRLPQPAKQATTKSDANTRVENRRVAPGVLDRIYKIFQDLHVNPEKSRKSCLTKVCTY